MANEMFGITALGTTAIGLANDPALRQYARWEYGTKDPSWILAEIRAKAPKRDLRTRLRYWLASFRGFAAYDVRGVDDPSRT